MPAPTPRFLLDNGTGTFPYDITSKVLYADGYNVTRGRDDWIGAVTAGELTLTLNNSDGRFTPGSTILGTPSPITVDQRIKVIETTGAFGFGAGPFGVGGFGGTGAALITGYVKSWPVSWPAVVTTFATVDLAATDAQARAERHTLRSMLEEEILTHGPSAYYTLGEPVGSTAAGDTSGNQRPSLTPIGTGTAPVFGATTDLPESQTGVQLAGGQYLSDGNKDTSVPSLTVGIGCVFTTSTTPSDASYLVSWPGWYLFIEPDGNLYMLPVAGGGAINSGISVVDGREHSAVLFGDGSTARLVIDGVVEASASISAISSRFSSALMVGGRSDIPAFTQQVFTGTVSNAAVWTGLTTADAIAITLGGNVVESGTARLARLAGYAGIPVGTLDPFLTNNPAQDTAGVSAWDAIQEVADAEMGSLYVDGSGNLAFHNRGHVTTKTTPDLTLDSQYVTPDVSPVTDDQQIVNYFEATSATGATQVVRDTASEDTHGRYPVSQTFLVQTDQEAIDRANWIVAKQAEPFTRYGTLTIDLFKMTNTQAATVLAALDLDCWLRVTSLAAQNPGGTVADVVVQGWRMSSSAEGWTVACNVVARSLYTAALWDDAGSLWNSAVWAI